MAGSGRRNADEALAVALASGATLRDAAAAAGIGERTATRRWADAAFRRRVAALRGELVGGAMGKLSANMGAAADKLRELLSSESDSVQLAAARAILQLGVVLREATEIEERLGELERQVGGRGHSNKRKGTS